MITGEQALTRRSEQKLSRKAAVAQLKQLGGDTWTTGRLGDLEKGKKTFAQFRPDEQRSLAAWLGVELQDLPAGDEAGHGVGDAVPAPAAEPSQPGGTIYGPHDDPVIWPVFDEAEEAHLLEVEPSPPPVGIQLADGSRLPPSDYDLARRAVVDAYDAVMKRLGGKPAPGFGWPSQYRADNCPPEDMPRILQWCEKVQHWLDQVDAGTGPFAAEPLPPPTTAAAADEQTPPAAAPAAAAVTLEPLSPPAGTVGGEATPTGQGTTTSSRVATQEVDQSVGVAALWRDGLRRVSNSELQTFKHCRRRWWLSWYRGLRLRAEPVTGVRELGTRIHDALAGWYVPDGQTPVDPRVTFNKIVEEDELALVKATASLEGDIVASKLSDFQKEAEYGRAMIEGYVQWLAEEGADAGYQVVAPEQVLQAVIEVNSKLSILLQGRLDVRLQREHDLVRLFMDHKSVGNFSQPAQVLPKDEQMKTYHVLEEANRQNGDPRVEGALYNMLRRVKRTAGANPPFYQRLELRHNPVTIERFRERLRGEAMQLTHTEHMLQEGIDHHVVAYPSPGAKCAWGCEFTAVCDMFDDGSRAEDFISEHYVTVNPLDRYDKDDEGHEA